jgi:hypothetical protein
MCTGSHAISRSSAGLSRVRDAAHCFDQRAIWRAK